MEYIQELTSLVLTSLLFWITYQTNENQKKLAIIENEIAHIKEELKK